MCSTEMHHTFYGQDPLPYCFLLMLHIAKQLYLLEFGTFYVLYYLFYVPYLHVLTCTEPRMNDGSLKKFK